ncbi:hypothetical protein Mapa_015920 [Marchantia paleacea]|nr:hypothetical protein Mapa_015920 [Marchantia paleacea]
METVSPSEIRCQNRRIWLEYWQTITLRAQSCWAWASNNLHPSLLVVLKALYWCLVISSFFVCFLAVSSLLIISYGAFMAPYLYVVLWLTEAVPIAHSTEPKPEQSTFYTEMVQILFVLASIFLFYILYMLHSLALTLFPKHMEKLSPENINNLPLLFKIVVGFTFYIGISVLAAVFTVAATAVMIFLAYLPYNSILLCDILGRYVPWYTPLMGVCYGGCMGCNLRNRLKTAHSARLV